MHIRAYHNPGEMNKLEAEYAEHLDLLKLAGDILDYKYEPESLKVGNNCRYTPDFRVVRKHTPSEAEIYIVELHEVKGTVRKKRTNGEKYTTPYCEDDALVKIKAAAEMHPYKFILVWKGEGGRWERKEIN